MLYSLKMVEFCVDTIFDAQFVCSTSAISVATTGSKALTDAATVLEGVNNASNSCACSQPGKFYYSNTCNYDQIK